MLTKRQREKRRKCFRNGDEKRRKDPTNKGTFYFFLFIYFLCWGSSPTGEVDLAVSFFCWYLSEYVLLCVCIKRSPLSFVDRNTRRHTRLNIDHLNHFLLLSRDGCCTHTNTHEMNETAVVVTQWVPQPAAWRLIRRVHLSRNEIKKIGRKAILLVSCECRGYQRVDDVVLLSAGREENVERRVLQLNWQSWRWDEGVWRTWKKFIFFSFSNSVSLYLYLLVDNSPMLKSLCPISTRERKKEKRVEERERPGVWWQNRRVCVCVLERRRIDRFLPLPVLLQ